MFIQVMQAKCTRADEVRTFADSYDGSGAIGFLGGTFGVTDDGEFLGIVRFESAEAARENSARPETDAWAQEFATLLDGPVSFDDYEDVTEFRGGGSDSAAFVQVIRGRVDDTERARRLVQAFGERKDVRPDVIGGTMAIGTDGGFTETVYFSDEAAARAGEQGEQPPADVEADIAWMIEGASFYDLRNPWFESAG